MNYRALLAVFLIAASMLPACGSGKALFADTRFFRERCPDMPCFIARVGEPTRRYVNGSHEVLEWDTRVHRKRFIKGIDGDSEWYDYYADCTFRATFDQNGDKISYEFIGAGCFAKDGELYEEGLFNYD